MKKKLIFKSFKPEAILNFGSPYLLLYLSEDKTSHTGITLLTNKKPSYAHIIKGITQLFSITQFKQTSTNTYNYNRYKFLPEKMDLPLLELIIKIIKDNGGNKGHNFSWLSYFLDLEEVALENVKKGRWSSYISDMLHAMGNTRGSYIHADSSGFSSISNEPPVTDGPLIDDF